MVSVSGGCDLEVRCHGEFDVDGERNQERSDFIQSMRYVVIGTTHFLYTTEARHHMTVWCQYNQVSMLLPAAV